MYRQPINTGRKPSSESFCSSLMHKMRWRSQERSPSGDQDKRPVHPKIKSRPEYSPRGYSEKCNHDGKRIKDVKYVAKKVRRVTSTIPLAVRSSQAFEVGKKGCETCSLSREGYKNILQSIKIIEILVDGVIEKEQTDLLDSKENGSDDGFGEGDRRSMRKNSSYDEEPSPEKDVNREKDAIDHNLKCILIMLQKCIGDTLVQICYVKSKNLSSEKKYKHFNIPISDLKLLKFEFTNLTHLIIPLFKKNVKGGKVDDDICVLCVKEKLIDCQVRLVDELKSGRNLKVVMKNGKARENENPCCSRDYPHVHAEAEGNPIVLKYSLPFQVNKPPEKDIKQDKAKTKQKANPNETGNTYPFQLNKPPENDTKQDKTKPKQTTNPNETANTNYFQGNKPPGMDIKQDKTKPKQTTNTKETGNTNVPDIKESPKHTEPEMQENKSAVNIFQPIDSGTPGATDAPDIKESPKHTEPETQENKSAENIFQPIDSSTPGDTDAPDIKESPKHTEPEIQEYKSAENIFQPIDSGTPRDTDVPDIKESPKHTEPEIHENKSAENILHPIGSGTPGATDVPDIKESPKHTEPGIQENKSAENNFQPIDSGTPGATDGEHSTKTPTNKTTKPIPYDKWPDEVDAEPKVKPQEKIESDQSVPIEDNDQIDGERDIPADSSNVSDIPERQSQVSDTDTAKSSPSSEKLSQAELDDANEEENNELYCGCNFDQVFEKLKINFPSNSDQNPTSFASGTDSLFTMASSTTDVGKRRKSNKKVSFYDDRKNQTVYPFQVIEPNTVFDMVPETSTNGNEKGEDFSNRTPFGETIKEAPVYLTAVDSIILAKQRLSSCECEPVEIKDLLEDKSVAVASELFIPKSEYLVQVANEDTPNIVDILPKPSRPILKKSKLIENILKDVDKNTLLALHSNPECCEEYSLKDYGSTSNLPIASSICSLPLDQNDLNSISAVLGKDISQAEIMLLSEEDTTDQMCVWETQYDDQSIEENRTKWLRAFAGTENPSHHLFTTLPDTRRESSILRRSIVNGYRTREVHQTLPTIAEEVALVADDEEFHLPYVPSISSLPLNEVELNELLKKKRLTAKHKTMELRYFTVEFPKADKSNKTSAQVNQNFLKSASSTGENKIPSSNESFHSCCSSTSDLFTGVINMECVSKDQNTLSPKKKTNSTLKAVDEMIMLNAIFLSDEGIEDKKRLSFGNISSQDIYKRTSDKYIRNHTFNGLESFDSVKINNPRRLSYTIIEDNSSQLCASGKGTDEYLATANVQNYKRVSNAINNFKHCEGNFHNNTSEELNESNHKDSIVSSGNNTNNKSYTILRNSFDPSINYNIPNIDNYQYTYLKDSFHLTDTNPPQFNPKNKQDISTTSSLLHSCPRINKSYTIINKINDANLPHIHSPTQRTNNDNKKSYTIIKDTVDPRQNSVRKGSHVDLIYKSKNNQVKYTQNNGRMAENDEIPEPDAVEWCREQLNMVLTEHSKYIKQSLQKENSSAVKSIRSSNNKVTSHKNSVICLISGNKSEKLIQPNVRRTSVPRGPLNVNEGMGKGITPPQSIISKLCELLETDKGKLLSSTKKLETSKMAEGDKSMKYDDLKSLLKNSLVLEDYGSLSNKKDFGFEKQYISVKKYSSVNKTEPCKIKFELTLDDKSYGNDQKENNNAKDDSKPNFSQNINFTTDVTDVQAKILTGYDAITKATPSVDTKCSNFSFNSDRPSGDHTSKAWYLYDASGLPLTDNSGRLLRKSNGELLVVCDALGIPVSDADRNPIYDAYGRSPSNSQFNPSKPLSIDILKTLTTATGNPIAVYDGKGRPLTSVSGTMLFDCTGRGLIRYGSHGNPISDLSGKPLFDANGRQITD